MILYHDNGPGKSFSDAKRFNVCKVGRGFRIKECSVGKGDFSIIKRKHFEAR